MLAMVAVLNRVSGLSHWLIRLCFAGTFVYHGLPKLLDIDKWFSAPVLGLPMLAIAVLEVAGGLLVLWGGFGPDWATRIGGLCIVPIMFGAVFIVHIGNGWSNGAKGVEWQAMLLAVSILFLTRGNALGRPVST
jgi:uncharacterized membrane protein YphA (DoxX/SURF4 family)